MSVSATELYHCIYGFESVITTCVASLTFLALYGAYEGWVSDSGSGGDSIAINILHLVYIALLSLAELPRVEGWRRGASHAIAALLIITVTSYDIVVDGGCWQWYSVVADTVPSPSYGPFPAHAICLFKLSMNVGIWLASLGIMTAWLALQNDALARILTTPLWKDE